MFHDRRIKWRPFLCIAAKKAKAGYPIGHNAMIVGSINMVKMQDASTDNAGVWICHTRTFI